MAKVRKQITLEPEVERRLDKEVENVSRFFNEKAKHWLDLGDAEKEEIVRQKKEKQEELEKVEEKIEELESKKAELQGDINALEQTLGDREKEQKVMKRQLPELVERTEKLRRDRGLEGALIRIKSTEQFHKLKNQVGMSAEELLDKLEEEVAE